MAEGDRSPRERMVFSAVQLIRREGVTSTSMRDVVEHARAPRGSLQHYFPGGKEQLVNEAVEWAARFASGRIDRFLAGMRRPTPSKLFSAMAGQWVEEFESAGFGAGCPLAAATIDCADSTASTRTAIASGFACWQRPVGQALIGLGVPARKAASLAVLMISALEGAILLARAQQDTAPLRTVVRELGPLLDDSVQSGAAVRDHVR
ncbi:MAG TPA: TetR/AcrR family transcriptional regulator [Jatrophihabitans sp.]|nr:TetR/AcrR family transcriptional regulator [Jatrophihabitans sp.]